MNDTKKSICFAIMPFSVREHDLSKYQNDTEHWNEVYQGLIVPSIVKAGLRAQRDDDDYSTRLVGEGVWKKIEQADIVLCDMSSHNPNVHLELGWALRSDKKIVLIKDEVTSFNFDLNQFYTYEYSSRLQPSSINKSISELAKVIERTVSNDVSNYSMVTKLQLYERAQEAANNGSIEVELLQEVLSEMRILKKNEYINNTSFNKSGYKRISLDIGKIHDLPRALVGTTWRKKNGLEEILFISESEFSYTSVGTRKWLTNDVSHNQMPQIMSLRWRHDNYTSDCIFDSLFSQFTEDNGEEWFLIAKQPYTHPSFNNA